MKLARRWVLIALINLILAAVLGLILRYAYVVELSWMKYSDVLHAHSHMAMLGWGYLVAFSLFYYAYRAEWKSLSRTINRIFILMEISALGLFICFPFFGYGTPTVIFLTAHMLFSYYFIYLVWNHIPRSSHNWEAPWIKASFFFLILSTLGVWFIAPIFILGLSKTIWYYLAVQFFLHFEINAWFLFAAMSLFFIHLRKSDISLNTDKLRIVFYLFFISCILTYALSVAWSKSNWIVSVVNTSGVVLQALGAGLLIRLLWPYRKQINQSHLSAGIALFWVASVSFFLKIIIQLSLIVPALMEVAYTIRNFIVGFIHLILLGIFTSYVLVFIRSSRIFEFNSFSKAGIILFITGYISTELIIFGQGGMFWMAWGFMPYYYSGLTFATLFLPAGLLLLLKGWKSPDTSMA